MVVIIPPEDEAAEGALLCWEGVGGWVDGWVVKGGGGVTDSLPFFFFFSNSN